MRTKICILCVFVSGEGLKGGRLVYANVLAIVESLIERFFFHRFFFFSRRKFDTLSPAPFSFFFLSGREKKKTMMAELVRFSMLSSIRASSLERDARDLNAQRCSTRSAAPKKRGRALEQNAPHPPDRSMLTTLFSILYPFFSDQKAGPRIHRGLRRGRTAAFSKV